MKRIARWLIDRLERDTGEELDYLREVAELSPGGFWKFGLSGPLLRHRRVAPPVLWHLARLGAVHFEDCGPCVQTAVNAARREGVPTATLREALSGGEQLPEPERDAYLFGRGVAGDLLEDEVRSRLEARIGRAGLVELTFAAATVRIFPAIKRGLGYARSCSLVPVKLE